MVERPEVAQLFDLDEFARLFDPEHAHNVVLEVASDTGTIGLAALLAAVVFLWRFMRQVSPARRMDAFPFALAVLLILFPINSHFAIYGTYTSSLIWFLVGLWAAALRVRSSSAESTP